VRGNEGLRGNEGPDAGGGEIPGKYLTTMRNGDLYRLVQASAGGYGDPLERDVHAVLDDVEQEKMSVDHVRREYGVVIDPATLQVDLRASDELRTAMRIQREASTG
jgi:N-methylhydantoinase B